MADSFVRKVLLPRNPAQHDARLEPSAHLGLQPLCHALLAFSVPQQDYQMPVCPVPQALFAGVEIPVQILKYVPRATIVSQDLRYQNRVRPEHSLELKAILRSQPAYRVLSVAFATHPDLQVQLALVKQDSIVVLVAPTQALL